MSRRSLFFTILSLVVGIVLVLLLVRLSHTDMHGVIMRLGSVKRWPLVLLALLMGLNTFLSSFKWRLIDRVLRHEWEQTPSSRVAFAVTSLGIALGQVLPVQLAVSIARTLVTWGSGRAVRRGTLGTLLEQGFDFIVVCFLAIASLATYFLQGGPFFWMTGALLMLAAAVPIVWGGTGLVSRIALRVAGEGEKNSSRWRKFVLELSESGLLDSKLGCKLLLISSLRFIVLVLMAGETTAAIGSTLPTWQLAVTMPFVVLSASLGITPGGLGLTEFTYATVLSLFGTPLAATSEWAIANRLLTAAASLIVGLVGVALLVARAPKNDKVTATEPEPAVHV